MEALQAASIVFEVVPGVTAGFAAASALQVSLTDRRFASKVIFLTGHRATDEEPWWGNLPSDATLVIYMPGSDYGRLAAQIVESGFSHRTHCKIVSHVGTPKEQALHTNVGALAQIAPLPAPCVVLVGHGLATKI
jgi:uroporphyrin-III C-methyltransferase